MSSARFFALVAFSAGALTLGDTSVGQVLLRGAGSTMSANYVEASRSPYEAAHGVSVQYDAVGSDEGIRRLATGRVDFELTDVPLTEFELEQLKLTQTPAFYCGVVVVVLREPITERTCAPGIAHIGSHMLYRRISTSRRLPAARYSGKKRPLLGE